MGLRNKQNYNDKHIFFITTTCYNKLPLFNIGDSKQILVNSLNFCMEKYSAVMMGYVIMPNHIHLIVHFCDGIKRSAFMRDFKKFTSYEIRKEIEIHSSNLLNKINVSNDKQLFKVWADRFDEVYIDSRELLEVKLNYIHFNPLQEHWNLVKRPEEFEHSSAMFYELSIQPLVKIAHYMDYT
jgi:putative transposase